MLREDVHNLFPFFSGRTTKRGGGPTEPLKKYFFLSVKKKFNLMNHYVLGGGGVP